MPFLTAAREYDMTTLILALTAVGSSVISTERAPVTGGAVILFGKVMLDCRNTVSVTGTEYSNLYHNAQYEGM